MWGGGGVQGAEAGFPGGGGRVLVLYLVLEGFCHGNLFFGKVKAIPKWPGMCVWGWDGGGRGLMGR